MRLGLLRPARISKDAPQPGAVGGEGEPWGIGVVNGQRLLRGPDHRIQLAQPLMDARSLQQHPSPPLRAAYRAKETITGVEDPE